ncbi:nicotinamide-nucleotide amidase [Amycolatopsis xylanica]|uniref:Nicotinamide-nucleotide amidase n=1 Tax=Amycolatopsis xylanica TaxID=589385 RepID=A0A1H3GDK5_9PSEU|nr:CinA family protein [Amycolatopsis xylanica]SDY01393.1 nicotinamide-nucleotide amidase [Amycolatopsis xylanica]
MDAAEVIARLVERGETVATAESLTAGLVCAALTDVPGSSRAVRGGLIVYATELKAELAGVDRDLLAEHGAVHPEVAAQLAGGARLRCRAVWGLGLTGVAGPDPQDGVSPGTVYVGLAGPVHLVRELRLDGDRSAIRVASVRAALDLLGEHLA